MLVQDIIDRVRNIAGDVNVLQFTDAQILTWVNDGTRECVIQNSLLQKRGTQVVTTGDGDYSLPADILKLHSVKYDNQKLSMLSLEEFEEQYGVTSNTETGTPTAGYVWAGLLNLYPKPDNSTSVLTIDYIRNPVDVVIGDIDTEGPDLPDEYHHRIVDYCLAQVAQQDDDMNRYQIKMQEFMTGVANLKDIPEQTYDEYSGVSTSARDMGDGGYG